MYIFNFIYVLELIQSPFLSNFPQIFNEPDIIDFFRVS